jgi:ribonuclease HII
LKRLFNFDQKFVVDAHERMAGVDEAGRGPLAGPVVAAAVIFYKKVALPGLNDSKQVPVEDREILFKKITEHTLFGIGVADVEEIDRINIFQASRLAMKRAVLSLPRTPELILIDGNAKIDWPLRQQTIIDGDAKSACIAAASILAKVYRDALMRHWDSIYPGYDFKQHKGYSTPQHLKNLRTLGPCSLHRKSFFPVHALFEERNLETQTS